MNKLFSILALMVAIFTMASCQESDDTFDPYHNWESRNARWFEQAADTARTEIAKAKAQAKATYGSDEKWEEFTPWRMFRTLMRAQDVQGPTTDSIVCKVIHRGTGTAYPAFNDSVRLHYRLWIMETEYDLGNGNRESKMAVASQTYVGEFNPATAAPVDMPVNGTVEGFQIALQNMVEGDDWMVYIPQEMGYQDKESAVIPAYSTLLYRLIIAGVYESGSGVPAWKARKK